jgi:hypothetical protein
MPGDGTEDTKMMGVLPGLAAMGTLLLLPGLLVVRAPSRAVPFLSLAFWALTWWWLAPFDVGRQRFLHAALMGFGLLLLLRLLKPLELRFPRPATVLVLGAALLLLIPVFAWSLLPGAEMSFHSLGAVLFAWRDGLPLSGEPLVSVQPFGAHAPALPTLAADVSLLSGLAPPRAVLLVHQVALGLLLVALDALFLLWFEPPVAALGAVLGLAIARVPTSLAAWGDGGPLLALAFAAAAAPRLVRSRSRAAAVAAGAFLATGLLAQPALTAAAVLALVAVVRPWQEDDDHARWGLAAGVALLAAVPCLWRLAAALSAREAVAALAEPGPLDHARWIAALAVIGGMPFAVRWAWLARRPLALVVLPFLIVAAAASEGLEWAARARELGPTPAERTAFLRAEGTRPLDRICVVPGSAGEWIPALAGRAVSHPWVPFVYRDEIALTAVACVGLPDADPQIPPGP